MVATKYEIWKFENGIKITNKYVITELSNSSLPQIKSFCMDKNNVFYIRDENQSDIVVIDIFSGLVKRIKDISKDVSFESMSIGSNGNVFALFCKNLSIGGGYKIIEFDCELNKVICSDIDLHYNDIYSVMGLGNEKYDVFIKGNQSIYGLRKDTKEAEYISTLSLDKYQYTKSCFIDGKNLLIFGINIKTKNGKKVNQSNVLLIEL